MPSAGIEDCADIGNANVGWSCTNAGAIVGFLGIESAIDDGENP
jgi:hypothetical protein